MAKYRKKPVVIDAFRYLGSTAPLMAWREQFTGTTSWLITNRGVTITTLEGEMLAAVGDWIIRGVNGEYYPCKPDIFEKTYEPADDEGDGGFMTDTEDIEDPAERAEAEAAERPV